MSMHVIPEVPLFEGDRVVQQFVWRDHPPRRPFAQRIAGWVLTSRRIWMLVYDEIFQEYAWHTFYDFADLGEGRRVAVDGARLYLDLNPPRTLRFDGLTIEEV